MSARSSSSGPARSPSSAGAAPVTLHIERVVLAGFTYTPAQGARLQAALEHELARLWTLRDARAAGIASSAEATASLCAPPLTLRGAGSSPASVGRDAARSLFALLGAR